MDHQVMRDLRNGKDKDEIKEQLDMRHFDIAFMAEEVRRHVCHTSQFLIS
jgi:hypothetical protein